MIFRFFRPKHNRPQPPNDRPGSGLLRGLIACLIGAALIAPASLAAAQGESRPAAQESTPTGTDPAQLSPEGERAALLINQIRVNAGLHPLRVHPLLTLAANLHIQDMTSSGVYGHTGSDGSSVHIRVARTGYRTEGWNGENWAVSTTVDKSVEWWMDDPPHRENVLNRSYTEMGIGTAPHPLGWGLILVVDFSTGSADGAGGYLPGGTETASPAAVAASVPADSPVTDSGLTHRVQENDTLFGLGQRYGVSWQAIAQLNGLTANSILQVGSTLGLPGGSTAPGAAGPDSAAPDSAAPDAPAANQPATASRTYTVVSGDTLLGIALRFGLTWESLAAANGLSGRSVLQIGDQLVIPGATAAVEQTESAPARSHTVQAGETVWTIAARYSVGWQQILQVNGLDQTALLQIGQVLRLP